jgi:myo-inositol 2-dehydrogenase / D-chiro-inositol 1-dehydrogenase
MSFKIAVIGCGWISTACHAPAYAEYARVHPQVRLAACCDRNISKAENLAAAFGFERAYTGFQAMLEAEQPDVVCLNIQERYLCQVGCQILQAGYPLLTEKPPGLTLEEIDRLITAAQSGGVLHQVAFNRRFAPVVQALKRSLEHLDVQHVQVEFTRVRRANEDFSTTAVHAVDLVSYLAGGEYQSIRFSYREMPEFGPNTANFYMNCELAGGITAQLNFLPVSGETLERYTVYAADNLLSARTNMGPDAPGYFTHYREGQIVRDVDAVALTGRQESYFLGGFYHEDAAFFDALQNGGRPAPDFSECRQSIEIMQCLRQRAVDFHR